jgi:hypothetical protein
MIDKPEETGCHGFILRIGRLTISVSYRAKRSWEPGD